MATIKRGMSQQDALGAFLDHAESWLTAADAPAIAALEAMAKQLDCESSPALLAQYGLAYRNLLKRQPAEAPEVDPVDALIEKARHG